MWVWYKSALRSTLCKSQVALHVVWEIGPVDVLEMLIYKRGVSLLTVRKRFMAARQRAMVARQRLYMTLYHASKISSFCQATDA